MTSFFAFVLLGFFLGMRHATDPDHVIAVTTIVAREKTPAGATAIGAVWGLGHTLTIMVVGGGIILFGWIIPPRIGLSMEFFIALMLIVLGIVNLTGVMRGISASRVIPGAAHQHVHPHSHGDFVHTHPHAHDPEAHPHGAEQTPLSWLDRHFGGLTPYQLVRPLVVGIVHGLAGSAAVALLVLTTIRNPEWGLWYLFVFGMGTILGMMLMTTVIALPFTRTDHRFARLSGGLRIASGVVSLCFGLFLAYRIGFVDGLFTGNPQWTPQ
ncbi:MAG: sulfite exporter TauE/SafE family protein [Gemmatimonadaceae bacterium]|nr:sulfite exporter TauE/SafE family protein [Gemmatimonadaceae bacterium]